MIVLMLASNTVSASAGTAAHYNLLQLLPLQSVIRHSGLACLLHVTGLRTHCVKLAHCTKCSLVLECSEHALYIPL